MSAWHPRLAPGRGGPCHVRLASPGTPRGLQARVIGPRIKPDSGAIEPDAETWANPEAWAPGAIFPGCNNAKSDRPDWEM